jgi:hypothetical protein
MQNRFEEFHSSCSYHGPFALTYLYMTQYVTVGVNSSYFARNDEMADFTIAFANRYLAAIDSWTNGYASGRNLSLFLIFYLV